MWIEKVKENIEWWTIKFFINPSEYIPSAVIAIYEKDWFIHARFPSWKTIRNKWKDIKNILEKLRRENSVIENPWKDKILDNEYVFVVSNEEVIIGNHTKITQILTKKLIGNILSPKEKGLISTFLKNSAK